MRKNMNGRLYEGVGEEVTATINIEPTSILGLAEGDVITDDMIDDPDDEALADLVALSDEVVVEEVIGDNSYKVNAVVSDSTGAASLYQWICSYTNVNNDEDIEEYVAPGLIALLNSDDLEVDPEADEITRRSIDDPDLGDGEYIEESVSSKFAKYRKMYEAALAESDNTLNEKGDDDDADADADGDGDGKSEFDDIFGGEGDSTEGDDKGSEDGDKDADSEGDGEDTEDVPMTAVILTVKKDDADKCKDELVAAGISEEDIEILEGEDDDENAKVKVDANAVRELKDYLSGKGIDLEEKIGGEIVDDEEGDGDADDKDKDDKKDDEEGDSKDDKGEGDDADGELDDINFDDLFGGDE